MNRTARAATRSTAGNPGAPTRAGHSAGACSLVTLAITAREREQSSTTEQQQPRDLAPERSSRAEQGLQSYHDLLSAESSARKAPTNRGTDAPPKPAWHTPGDMHDTSDAAFERYYELLRSRPPLARITAAAELSSAVRQMAEAGIRAADPHASPRVVQARLARRLYGAEVAARLFPDCEDDGG